MQWKLRNIFTKCHYSVHCILTLVLFIYQRQHGLTSLPKHLFTNHRWLTRIWSHVPLLKSEEWGVSWVLVSLGGRKCFWVSSQDRNVLFNEEQREDLDLIPCKTPGAWRWGLINEQGTKDQREESSISNKTRTSGWGCSQSLTWTTLKVQLKRSRTS